MENARQIWSSRALIISQYQSLIFYHYGAPWSTVWKKIHELFSFFVIVLCFYTSGLWKRKLICFLTALFEFSFLPYEETSIGKWSKKGFVSQLQRLVEFVILHAKFSGKYDQSNHLSKKEKKTKKNLPLEVFNSPWAGSVYLSIFSKDRGELSSNETSKCHEIRGPSTRNPFSLCAMFCCEICLLCNSLLH